MNGISRNHGILPANTMATASTEGHNSAKTAKAITSPWAKFTSRITPKISAIPKAPSA